MLSLITKSTEVWLELIISEMHSQAWKIVSSGVLLLPGRSSSVARVGEFALSLILFSDDCLRSEKLFRYPDFLALAM